MSLTTPEKIRKLQRELYRKAQQEPSFRFDQLYDKIWREDILADAYAVARANGGAAGVERETFEQIETAGREEWLQGLQEEIRTKTYRPQPVRRVTIPKPAGGERPLGIPTVRDRVACASSKRGRRQAGIGADLRGGPRPGNRWLPTEAERVGRAPESAQVVV